MRTTHFRRQLHLHWQKITAITLLSFCCTFSSINTHAQNQEIRRIYDEFYDDKPVHFGFLFGLSSSRFNVSYSDRFTGSNNPADSVVSLVSPGNFAFQVGGIVNLKLSETFDLKSGINISLFGRQIDYRFPYEPARVYPEFRESTWLEIPLMLKFKSQRRGNSRMYVAAGIKYGIEANVRKSVNKTRLNTTTSDLSLEYGIGFERFFQYFKFTPELRFSTGLVDMFVQPSGNSNLYSRGIDRLSSHTVTLYLMFE